MGRITTKAAPDPRRYNMGSRWALSIPTKAALHKGLHSSPKEKQRKTYEIMSILSKKHCFIRFFKFRTSVIFENLR